MVESSEGVRWLILLNGYTLFLEMMGQGKDGMSKESLSNWISWQDNKRIQGNGPSSKRHVTPKKRRGVCAVLLWNFETNDSHDLCQLTACLPATLGFPIQSKESFCGRFFTRFPVLYGAEHFLSLESNRAANCFFFSRSERSDAHVEM